MAKPYRMTARRRAALRRAQEAAARKRRLRRKRIAVGVGIGVASATLATAGGAVYVGRTVSRVGRAASWQSAPGLAVHNRKIRELRGNRNKVKPRKGVFKAQDPGKYLIAAPPTYVKRHRPAYDAKRRAQYAASKKTVSGKRIRGK